MKIAEKITKLRKGAGLTQRELALELGVTPSAVGNYEQGISFPREEILYKLFEVLECTPNELFGYEENYNMTSVAARKGKNSIKLRQRSSQSIFDEPDYH